MALSIDRIAPTRRPDATVAGHQRWRDLLFLHWPIDPDVLRPHIPDGLDVDTFDGRAYIGLVPFAMFGVRPRWLPRALAFDFLETNVRTYVHAGGADPGVYFFSLDAASWLAVRAARLGWSLPYFYARMTMDNRDDGSIDYTCRRGDHRLAVRYRVGRELGASQPGTLEHFLCERYLLHVRRRGAVYTGQVHHTPYPLWTADVESLDDSLVAAAGFDVAGQPLAHYSSGVDVEVFSMRRSTPRLTTRG